MAKKRASGQVPRPVMENIDIERLKHVTRAMIERLEQALAAAPLQAVDAASREQLFGAKGSLVSSLVVLADLILKLQRVDAREPAAESAGDDRFDENDVALIQEYLSMIKKP